MYQGHRYIDSDAHVLEPSDLWERYLDPKYKEFMPKHEVGYEGDGPSLSEPYLASKPFPGGPGQTVDLVIDLLTVIQVLAPTHSGRIPLPSCCYQRYLFSSSVVRCWRRSRRRRRPQQPPPQKRP